MKRRHFLVMLCMVPYMVKGQIQFHETSNPFVDVAYSSSAFTDVNGDGNTDLFLMGESSPGTHEARLYLGDGLGGFTEKTGLPFVGIKGLSQSLGLADVNGNGTIDVLMGGIDDAGATHVGLYLNDGAGNFIEKLSSGILAVYDLTVQFGDFDNNGTVDLFTSGDYGSNYASATYRNNGSGLFSLWTFAFPSIDSPLRVDTANVLSGSYPELITNSSYLGNAFTELYLNSGGTFLKDGNTLFSAYQGDVAIGDVNGDGHNDIFITGATDAAGSTVTTRLYINDGAGNLTETASGVNDGVWHGILELFDADDDDDLDLILMGASNASMDPVTLLYTNNGVGSYTKETSTNLTGLNNGSLSIGDVNGDDIPDLFISGFDASGSYQSLLYQNKCTTDIVEVDIDTCGSYDFDGSTLTSTGQYIGNFTNLGGCDSLVTLNLTFLNEEHYETIYTTGNFEFDGNTLASTGIYNATFTNQDGCDSLVHLSLTIEPDPGTVTSFTWFEPLVATPNQPVKADMFPFTQGDVRMGDLDGDGDLDIITNGVVDYDAGGAVVHTQTRVYLNDGFSNFIEKSDAGLIGRCFGEMELFDADGDGDLDVLQVGWRPDLGHITTLDFNDGTGRFTSVATFDLPTVSSSNIGVGDLDGDGDKDVVITGLDQTISNFSQIFFNDGNGQFSEDKQSTLLPVREGDIAIGDLNNDGSLDIVITGTDGVNNQTQVYLNNGSGVFTELTDTNIEPRNKEVSLVDVDQNNTLDIVIRKHIYLNDGTADFTLDTASLDPFVIPGVRLVDDFNQDGIQDMAIMRAQKTQILLGVNQGGYTLSEELPPLREGGAAVGDLDGDGYPEIVASGQIGGGDFIDTEFYVNDGTGKFIQNELHSIAELSDGDAAFADLDGDGDHDLITCGNTIEPHSIYTDNQETTKLYFNDGSGIFTEDTSQPFYQVSGEIVVGDFNGDTYIDAFITGHEFDRLSSDPPYSGVAGLYLNDGTGQFTIKSDAGIQNSSSNTAEAADLDNDGDLDLILNARIMLNDGSGVFTISTNHDMVNLNHGTLSLGDVNGDGYVDAFRAGDGSSSSLSRLYINDGTGGLYRDTNNSFTGIFGGSSNLVDMDGDGDLDLFVTGWNSSGPEEPYSQLYFNDGSGNFSQDQFNEIINLAEANSKFSDLDGDGDQDLIISGLHDSNLVAHTKVYINNSLGIFKEYPIASLANLRRAALEIADVDGDGGPDIFISGYRSNTESRLYRNTICQNTTKNLVIEVCDSYTFFGQELTSSGLFSHVSTNGCGKINTVNLDLTILESTSSNEDVETCDSYHWNGVTYTSSGIYQEHFTNAVGCDSTATLNLTILESTLSNENVESCVSYDWNGMTYTTSGTYQGFFINAAGCDSTAILNLTILEPTSGVGDVDACDSYDWNGATFTTSGTYQSIFTNAAGCDSTAMLNLTILEPDAVDTSMDTCGDYQFGSQLLTESGVYVETFTNLAGCDSTVTLTFGYIPLPEAEIEVNGVILFATELSGASYQWYDCDTGEAISGEDKRQLTPPRTGEYYVEVISAGCSSVSDCVLFDWVLSVDEVKDLKVYPTVSHGQLSIESDQVLADAYVQVISLSGKNVFSRTYKNLLKENIQLNVPAGVYVIQVQSEGRVQLNEQLIIND